jgi:hypothetical protein
MTSFSRLLSQQGLDLIKYPIIVFRHRISWLMEGASHPTTYMELADLMFHTKFFCHPMVGDKIIRDDCTCSLTLDQRFQEVAHCPGVIFIHMSNRSWLSCAQIHCNEYWLLPVLAQWI